MTGPTITVTHAPAPPAPAVQKSEAAAQVDLALSAIVRMLARQTVRDLDAGTFKTFWLLAAAAAAIAVATLCAKGLILGGTIHG